MRLSILIPVYNAEKYLKPCLDSIFDQTDLKKVEIIAVDDGSTDNSLQTLQLYSVIHPNLKVFSRENHGYGATLNFAISKATGTFVSIVEPDDFIHKEMYETLLDISTKTSADIIKCSFFNYHGETGKATPERVFHEVKDFSNSITPSANTSIFFVMPSIWSCLYRRRFLTDNHIQFLETPGASFQDTGFQFKTFAAAKKIYCLEKPYYYYRRDNSASSVKSAQKVLSVKEEFDSVDEFLKTHHLDQLQEVAAACRFRTYIWNLDRLPFSDALKFAKIARADYRHQKTLSAFRSNFYVKHHFARPQESSFATAHPVAYVFLRPLFRLYNNWKHKMYVIMSSI